MDDSIDHNAHSFDRSTSPPHLVSPLESPRFPPQRPPPRIPSTGSISFAAQVPPSKTPSPSFQAFEFDDTSGSYQGLGISSRRQSITRVPVGARRISNSSPPNPAIPFDTPSTTAAASPYTPASSSNPFLSPLPKNDSRNVNNSYNGRRLSTMLEDEQDISSGRSVPSEDMTEGRDTELGENHRGYEDSESLNDKSGEPDGCPPDTDIHTSRKSWLSITILCLSVYSTVFSGIWLVVAFYQPRYGGRIQSGGKLTPETASVIFALIAKTIELSFVSVFVAFLGQVLSRRSLVKSSRGVTIAELTMRTWVLQPAVMITHVETLKHAGLTFLGLITLTNAFVAMFYTTASDSLVSPHLKFGKWDDRTLYGTVKTSYANPTYVASLCHNPTDMLDPTFSGTTCLSLLHAGQAFSNHINFLDQWADISKRGEGIEDSRRPLASATLFDNTNVTGTWIENQYSNMSASYEYYKRIVNNVTLAMPHAGIYAAAREKKNGILQPENLGGVGEYRIRAAVVSPAVNVLCVNMEEKEMGSLIYTNWPGAKTIKSDIPGQKMPLPGFESRIHPEKGQKYLNSTVVDDVFEWGPKYKRQPPVFSMYPMDYNSVINASVPWGDNSDSIYVLFKAPDTITTDYTLCKLRSVLSPKCSTHYTMSGIDGGSLKSVCDDPDEDMTYELSAENVTTVAKADWMNVGSQMLFALSLNTGVSNANASSSRLISQLVTKMPDSGPPKLNPLMPSIAESMAVMAGSTLLLSTTDSTFYHYWNWTATTLEGAQLPFNASIQSQEYTSGYIQRWTMLFYLVLIIVFITNVFCLVYFFLRSGLVTDYSEPQNLFALAVNSPQSTRMYGSCGAGPEGDQFNVDWHIQQEEETGHLYIKEGEKAYLGRQRSVFGRRGPRRRMLRSETSYSKLSSKRKSWL